MSPGLSVGETMIFKVSVTSAGGPMNVALVWTDPAAAPRCNACLLNDLDLTLRSPGGYWYHGNRYECAYDFWPGPPYESCEHQYPWQLTPDRDNNVETFYAITPPTGTWEARITAPFITSGTTQPFALVVTGHGLTQDIGGIVRDAASGSPFSNAQVTLAGVQNSYMTTTGSDGRFSVAAAPDTYTMTTDGGCRYLPDSRSVTSDPGFLREEEVFLTKRGLATVFGTVKDDGNNPLVLATVQEACTGTYVLTGTGGSYSLTTVPGGVDVQVTASKLGYISDTKTVNVAPGGSEEEHFILPKIGCTVLCPI